MIWPNQIRFSALSWNKPIVYAWFRGEVCLYVGMSVCGLARPLNRKHHIIGRALKLHKTDKLCWIEYPTEAHAILMERFLIRNLQPKFNSGRGEAFKIAIRKFKLTVVED